MINLILRTRGPGYFYKDRTNPKSWLLKPWIKITLRVLGSLLLIWGGLTLWVERERTDPVRVFQAPVAEGRALILYNPDPIYDLDRQVGEAFASTLNARGWEVRLATHAQAGEGPDTGFDLYVFIANTYNWAPDRPTLRYIRKAAWLSGKPVVAITLGSGSTTRSKRLLEAALQAQDARVVASETYWLLRPNDESRMEESNVRVAAEKSEQLALKTATSLQKFNKGK